MLDKIIHFSIKNKFIIGLFTLAIVVWGGYSVTQLPIDALPDITNNQVQIITTSPSLAAQEVEQFITYPIELAVKSIPRVVELRSVSRFGLSTITVVFEEDADIYWARAQISERLKDAEKQIPEGLGDPDLAPISTGLGEIYQYVVFPKPGYEDKYDAMSLRTVQDWIIKPQLTGTPGVAEVNTLGGYLRQYEISVQPDKLKSMNTTITEVFEALERNNENTGGAYIDKKPYAYFIRAIGMVSGLEDIKKIVVKNQNGIPILIRDVADVREGNAIRYGAVTKDGTGEVVGGMVMMLKGENSAKVVKRVKDRVEQIKTSLPEGVDIEPFLDRSKLVNRAIGTVGKNLLEGALIVIFILVLLIGNLRAGLVVASVIPLSLLFAVSMMNLFGVSGNLMSLGAIDFGLIVDGAVIIVESIVHRITRSRHQHVGVSRLTGPQMDSEVFESARRMMNSASFGQIIILIVYLPILSLVGIEGKMFKPMAQTVSFAILGAFILSLTYIPMMSAFFLSKETGHKANISDKIMNFLHRVYEPVLNGALKWKIPVIASAVVLLVISFLIFKNLGGEFIPTLDEGDIATHVISMPGSSLMQEVEATTRAEKILKEKFPEVEMAVSKIGTAEIPTDPMPMEVADVMVIMKEKEEWTSAKTREEMMLKMEDALNDIPGIMLEFTQPIQMRFNELMTGVRSDVAIKIFGEDIDLLVGFADQIVPIIQTVNGVEDARAEQVKGLPQITVRYNYDKLALYGLNVGDINKVLRTAFAGEASGVVYEGEKRFDLVVRLQQDARQDIDDVKSLFISLPGGNQIPLEQVADVKYELGPIQISREEGKRRIVIGFNVRNRDVKSAVDDIQQKLAAQFKLPPGYYLTYGGQFQNLVEANKRLSVAVPIALALIFVLLYFTFRSVKQSLLIYTAIPFSAIGGVFALWMRGMPFSISAGVGFIALFGVAVLNGIVLIAYFNQLKNEGMKNVIERIKEGTKVRLRPVIMTAAVASLGFLPMAISTSAGAEVQKPLATVVIGGLLTATLLTLVVLPILYLYFERGVRGKSKVVAASVLLPLLFFASAVQAQTTEPLRVDLGVALDYALKNNLHLQSQQLNVQSFQKLKKSSFELPKTEVEFQYGQFNSINDDNSFKITQSISFPSVYAARSKLYKAQLTSSELQLLSSKVEISYRVHSVYDNIVYLQGVQLQLQKFDSLYADFVRAASLRYETGETNLLEKTTAETKRGELLQLVRQNEAELNSALLGLKTLMGYSGEMVIAENQLQPVDMDAPDTSLINNNPVLKNLYQQAVIAHQNKKLETAQTLPDFSAGYFNQSIIGLQTVNGSEVVFSSGDRFTGFNVGIGIPLTFFSNSSKVKSLELQQQSLQLQAEYGKQQLQAQLQQAFQDYLKNKSITDYYSRQALPNADLITSTAQKGYQSGDIGYVEYLQSLQTAGDIRLGYLKALLALNQSVININFLVGNF